MKDKEAANLNDSLADDNNMDIEDSGAQHK